MKNYETPKIQVIEIDTTDIIQTSGLTNAGDVTIPGTGVIVPIPTSNSLDDNY